MSQSSPTPAPVAWMVLNPRGDMVAFSPASEEDCRKFVTGYPGARLVPLFDQPSALPATTPSDTPLTIRGLNLKLDVERVIRAARFYAEYTCSDEETAADVARACRNIEQAGLSIVQSGVSPSEGSAPDTLTTEKAQ